MNTPTETPLAKLVAEMREEIRSVTEETFLSTVVVSGKDLLRVLEACDEMREALEQLGKYHDDSGLGACSAAFTVGAKCTCNAGIARAVLAKHFGETKP